MSHSNNPAQLKPDPHFGTKAIHVGQSPDQWSYKDVVPPISLTTTYKQYGPNDHAVRFYTKQQLFVGHTDAIISKVGKGKFRILIFPEPNKF